jgi:hypothetical protein
LHSTPSEVAQPEATRHFARLEGLFAFLRAQEGLALDQQEPADSLYCTVDRHQTEGTKDAV